MWKTGHPNKYQKNPRDSEIILKIPKDSKGIQKNPKDFKIIQKILKESKWFQKITESSKRIKKFQKTPKDSKEGKYSCKALNWSSWIAKKANVPPKIRQIQRIRCARVAWAPKNYCDTTE